MSDSKSDGLSSPEPAADPPTSGVSKHPSRKASSTSGRGRRSTKATNHAGPMTIYRSPFTTRGGPQQGNGGGGAFTGPSPPLRISTRRLQVFSYVLAELSSAATLLPDYTRAILNLSRKLIGAWQAITAAAISRTRYEHALIWAAYRYQQQQQQKLDQRQLHRQQQQQRRSSSSAAGTRTPSATEGGVQASLASEVSRGQRSEEAGRRTASASSHLHTNNASSDSGGSRTGATKTNTTTSAAASLFDAAAASAAAASSSAHKRRRLSGVEDATVRGEDANHDGEENSAGSCGGAGMDGLKGGGGDGGCASTTTRARHGRPSSALKLKRSLYSSSAHGGRQQGFDVGDESMGRPALPPRVSSSPAQRPSRAEKAKGKRCGQTNRNAHSNSNNNNNVCVGGASRRQHRHTATPLPPFSLSGAAERRARQLVCERREQLFAFTLQQLWLDAQEKEDRAGQHVEYLRGVMVNVLFQQYLGVTVEQSYHDLVLYRWLAPVLVSARDGSASPTVSLVRGEGTRRGRAATAADDAAAADSEDSAGETRQPSHSTPSAFASPASPVAAAPAGELEHGGGGANRRARRRQAAAQVAQDVRLLRQMVRRAQITAGPAADRPSSRRQQHQDQNNEDDEEEGQQKQDQHPKEVSSKAASRPEKLNLGDMPSRASFPSSCSSASSASAATSTESKKRPRTPSSDLPPKPPQTRRVSENPRASAAAEVDAEAGQPNHVHAGSEEGEDEENPNSAVPALPTVSSERARLHDEGVNEEAPAAPLHHNQTTAPELKASSAPSAKTTASTSPGMPPHTAEAAFYAALHGTNLPPPQHSTAPLTTPPLLSLPEHVLAVPLPLQIFLQACTSFDPTHCAFSLMSRCVVFAQHVRSEDEEQARPANSVASSPSKHASFGGRSGQTTREPSATHASYHDLQMAGEENERHERAGEEEEEEPAEEFAGLFYVVIARRAVGACGHAALCFGNHKFIFVRCRDTEALIREVLLSDEETEDDEGAEDGERSRDTPDQHPYPSPHTSQHYSYHHQQQRRKQPEEGLSDAQGEMNAQLNMSADSTGTRRPESAESVGETDVHHPTWQGTQSTSPHVNGGASGRQTRRPLNFTGSEERDDEETQVETDTNNPNTVRAAQESGGKEEESTTSLHSSEHVSAAPPASSEETDLVSTHKSVDLRCSGAASSGASPPLPPPPPSPAPRSHVGITALTALDARRLQRNASTESTALRSLERETRPEQASAGTQTGLAASLENTLRTSADTELPAQAPLTERRYTVSSASAVPPASPTSAGVQETSTYPHVAPVLRPPVSGAASTNSTASSTASSSAAAAAAAARRWNRHMRQAALPGPHATPPPFVSADATDLQVNSGFAEAAVMPPLPAAPLRTSRAAGTRDTSPQPPSSIPLSGAEGVSLHEMRGSLPSESSLGCSPQSFIQQQQQLNVSPSPVPTRVSPGAYASLVPSTSTLEPFYAADPAEASLNASVHSPLHLTPLAFHTRLHTGSSGRARAPPPLELTSPHAQSQRRLDAAGAARGGDESQRNDTAASAAAAAALVGSSGGAASPAGRGVSLIGSPTTPATNERRSFPTTDNDDGGDGSHHSDANKDEQMPNVAHSRYRAGQRGAGESFNEEDDGVEEEEEEATEEPLYVVMYSVLCSCVRGTSERGTNDSVNSENSGAGEFRSAAASTPQANEQRGDVSLPSSTPRESAFPSSLKAAEALAQTRGSMSNTFTDTTIYDDFPLSYFEQQVLLPPSSGQERRTSMNDDHCRHHHQKGNRNSQNEVESTSEQQRLTSALSAMQNSAARAAAASHFFHMADPLHAAAARTTTPPPSPRPANDGEDDGDESITNMKKEEESEEMNARPKRADLPEEEREGGSEALRGRHAPSTATSGAFVEDVQGDEEEAAISNEQERRRQRSSKSYAHATTVRCGEAFAEESGKESFSPAYPPFDSSAPSSPVEPTEGDLAFAAELYSRLQFWSLRGQDRSEYIDPSWLRTGADVKEANATNRADISDDTCATEADEEARAAEPARGQQRLQTPSNPAAAATEAKSSSLPDRHRHISSEGGRAEDSRSSSATSDSNEVDDESRNSSNGEHERSGSRGRTGMVRLPLKLLNYAAGTIELADEAFLAAQQRKERAKKAAEAKRARRERRRQMEAETKKKQMKTGEAAQHSADGRLFSDSASQQSVLTEDSFSGDEEGEEEEEENEAYEDDGSFPFFTPVMTVNARGKELLFEALHAATEVVVCAVRESRAHTGYHDILHQRCPPPPHSSPANSSPTSTPAVSGAAGEEKSGGCSGGVNTSNPSNSNSAFHGASPLTAMNGALTTVNTWALTASAAAMHGCTFPVPTGTLSHDERCPFTFDRHQHLGTYGTVQWSQGNAAVMQRDGQPRHCANNYSGSVNGGAADGSAGAVVEMSESSLTLPPPPPPLSASPTLSSSAQPHQQQGKNTKAAFHAEPRSNPNHTSPPKHGAGRNNVGAGSASSGGSFLDANRSGGYSGTGTAPTHAWRWPSLPANDEKQWRCELLKSEFRLARSRCLDALLVDHVHGRPIAAITLEPRTWTQMQDEAEEEEEAEDDEVGNGDHNGRACKKRRGQESTRDKGGLHAPSQGSASHGSFARSGRPTSASRSHQSHNTRSAAEEREGNSPHVFPALPSSPREVVQRTVYVVTSFTHYVAPLWRHLREEKAVLVDMDRTLVDNVVTVRTLAERQRHLLHLNRAVAAAEGKAGAVNPCLLMHSPLSRHAGRHRRPSSARFAAPPFRMGRNDAPALTLEEVLYHARLTGTTCCSSDDENNSTGGKPYESGAHEEVFLSAHAQPSRGRPCSSSVRAPASQPSASSFASSTSAKDAVHTAAGVDVKTEGSDGEGLLHAFLHRTATQRESLGTLHYEECGAVTYAAGALYASIKAHESSAPAGGNATKGWSGGTGMSSNSECKAAADAPRAGVYSDLVYVRPGVRQFLYRTAVQWNIPVVLVTKSTRSRTEAILRNVLDPHRILFPDARSCIVTADEMLSALSSLSSEEPTPFANTSAGRGGTAAYATPCTSTNEHPDVKQQQLQHPSSLQNSTAHESPSYSSNSNSTSTTTTSTSMVTTTTASIAERIARCHKSTLRVLQCVLDADALRCSQRAWRAPPWWNVLARLPKPRSIAVLDDAPQVWAERDWPCTVNIAAYTLARVDPVSYFSPHGYMSALVLSCLYGSKCLVCSTGELRVGAASAEASSHASRQNSPLRGDGSHGQSPLSDPARTVGPERWPHCICVCPVEHQDDLFGADDPQESPFTPSMSDAAATMRAMLADLVWRTSAGPGGGGQRSVLLRRLKPLLLMPTTVGADASVVEEGPSPRSTRNAAGSRFNQRQPSSTTTVETVVGGVIKDGDDASAVSPGRQTAGSGRGVGSASRPGGFHGHCSSIIEDVEPLPPPHDASPTFPSALNGESDEDVNKNSNSSSTIVAQLKRTFSPQEVQNMTQASTSQPAASLAARTTVSTEQPMGPPVRCVAAQNIRLVGDAATQTTGKASVTGPRPSQRATQPSATSAPSTPPSPSRPSTSRSTSASDSTTSSSSLLSPVSVSDDAFSHDGSVSPYSIPIGTLYTGPNGSSGFVGGYGGATVAPGASMPATPTSFTALPDPWTQHGGPLTSAAGLQSGMNHHNSGTVTTPPSAVLTSGVADVTVNAPLEEMEGNMEFDVRDMPPPANANYNDMTNRVGADAGSNEARVRGESNGGDSRGSAFCAPSFGGSRSSVADVDTSTDTQARSYEDVEPLELAHTRSGVAAAEAMEAAPWYAPTTATRPHHGRSTSSNSDVVEDVVPLEVQPPAPTTPPHTEVSCNSTNNKSGKADNDDVILSGDMNAPVAPSARAVVVQPGKRVSQSKRLDMTTRSSAPPTPSTLCFSSTSPTAEAPTMSIKTAVSPRASVTETDNAVNNVEATPPCAETCEGELRRPQRRRLDDSHEDVEDVVPL